MNPITVVGSINLDTNLRVAYMPKPGETIHTKEMYTAGGGKGANQAVSAQRSGAKTRFIGAIGDDAAGQVMLELLEQEAIDTSGIQQLTNKRTGQAFITVDEAGENSIMIHGGANSAFSKVDVQNSRELIATSQCVIAQFETPLESTLEAFLIAREANVHTILNPAPALAISEDLVRVTDIIVPNETETQILTKITITDEASMKQAAAYFHDLGVKIVIITLGSKGAFYSTGTDQGIVPAFKVKAVDTTAAGDTFIGAFAAYLTPDLSNFVEAIRYGNLASSIAVQRFGAQPSIPTKDEITEAMK